MSKTTETTQNQNERLPFIATRKGNAYFLLPQSRQIHRLPWAGHQNLHKNF